MMKKITFILLLLFLGISINAQRSWHFAITGSDITGTGTIANPFATLQVAIDAMTTEGDTVIAHGGTYYTQTPYEYNPTTGNGVHNGVITSKDGEWAIFDGIDHCSLASPPAYNSFLTVSHTNGITIQNIEVRNYFQCQYVNSGVFGYEYSINSTFRNLYIHDFSTPRGFSGGGGAWWTHYRDPNFSVEEPYWDSTYTDSTYFINVVIHDLCDTLGGGNAADGYKLAFYGNNYVEWRDCRTYSFSDDGWDVNSIDGAELVFYNCYAMSTQKYERYDIEGNGYKWTTLIRNNSDWPDDFNFIKVYESVAAGNNYMGFYPNLYALSDRDDINGLFYKSISTKNNYSTYLRNTSGDNKETYKNNIFFDNTSFAIGTEFPTNGSNNNFSVSDYTNDINISEWDFLSIDLGEIAKPFDINGLPDMNLFKLRGSSQLINAGTTLAVSEQSAYVNDSAGFTPLANDIGLDEYIPLVGDTELDILSFTFDQQSSFSVYDFTNHTVTATIFYQYRNLIDELIPIVLPSDGDTISPGFMTTVDFTNPVTYTVYEIDNPGRSQTWTITINVATPSSFCDIRSIYVYTPVGPEIIRGINIEDTIVACFYGAGTPITSLTPTITIDRGATITPTGAQNFTGGYIDYTVTAEDGITQKVWRVTMELLAAENGSNGIVGFNNIFPVSETTSRIRYSPYTATTGGIIQSLSIYHNGGSGLMQMGIYTDSVGSVEHPRTRLALTSQVTINAFKGWQTIPLTSPLTVTSGQRIWIAYVFQTNPGYRVLNEQTNNPDVGFNDVYGYGWNTGLQNIAPNAMMWHFITSAYASYTSGIDIGGDYYVATWGDDSNPGSFSQPWATWQKAFETAQAGDTVYFRGGVWYPQDYYLGSANAVTIIAPDTSLAWSGDTYGNQGTYAAPICFFNYPGETPILDCSQVDTIGHQYNNAIEIYNADFLHFRGLTIRNVFQPSSPNSDGGHSPSSGIGIIGTTNLTFENITIHNTGGRAFSGSTLLGYRTNDPGFDTTRFINCDIYEHNDILSNTPGNAADGYKITLQSKNVHDGNPNGAIPHYYLTGCRSWKCSDDGTDIGGVGTVDYDNCWFFNNGNDNSIDGNGLKMGGVFDSINYTIPLRSVKNCIMVYNRGIGLYDLQYDSYYQNNSRIYNNLIYKNAVGMQLGLSDRYTTTQSIYRNNIVYGSTDLDAASRPQTFIVSDPYTESNNTFDYWADHGSLFAWQPASDVTVTDADFTSVDSVFIMSEMLADRKEDGSLPDITWARLVTSSDLVGAGINVGMSAKPDIGVDWNYLDGNPFINVRLHKVISLNKKTIIIRGGGVLIF
jgi:hypothetical protein